MATDVVVCAHNEEDSIARILSAIRGAPELGTVIVVADACTDATIERALPFEPELVEVQAHNKGSAMAAGLRAVRTTNVCFVDADLIGLEASHISALLTLPPAWGQVVGLRDQYPAVLGAFPPITGERRLPTQLAVDAGLDGSGWRAEFRINAVASKCGVPWAHYVMHGVTNPRRPKAKEYTQLATGILEHGRDLARYMSIGRRVG